MLGKKKVLEVIKGPGSFRQISVLSVWGLPSGPITPEVRNGVPLPNLFGRSLSRFLGQNRVSCPWQQKCAAEIALGSQDACPVAWRGVIFPRSTGLRGGGWMSPHNQGFGGKEKEYLLWVPSCCFQKCWYKCKVVGQQHHAAWWGCCTGGSDTWNSRRLKYREGSTGRTLGAWQGYSHVLHIRQFGLCSGGRWEPVVLHSVIWV